MISAQPAQNGSGTLTVDRKGVKNLGEDIRFIKTKTSLSEDKGFFVGKPAYWILVALLLLGAAAVWLSLRKLAARRADVAGSRGRKATRQAMKRLKLAGDFLNKNLYHQQDGQPFEEAVPECRFVHGFTSGRHFARFAGGRQGECGNDMTGERRDRPA